MIGVNRGENCTINISNTFSIKNVGLMKPNHVHTSGTFIQYYLSSPVGSRLLLVKSKGGAQPFVGLSELRAWPIALPPYSEQHRIVAEVDRLLSIVREAEAEVEANLKRAQGLRNGILGKAFTQQ
jgi:type I restriction enzyme S subunit